MLREDPVSQPGNETPGIARNSVISLSPFDVGLEVRGDSLFIGPCLNLTTDGGASFQTLTTEQICGESPGRLTALDVEADVAFAGLGRIAPGGANAAVGFLLSRDGGHTFVFRQPQLDAGPEDTVRYGVSVLPSLPVVTPEQSRPAAVDYVDSTGAAWVAGRASGLRRSTDGGQTFERIVLPPDSLDFITPAPDTAYTFALRPKRGETGPGQFNHIASSVLVDETGTVWAGTSAGVNRSRPEDVFVFERPGGGRFTERAWRRFGFDNTAVPGAPDTLGQGLSGNFVPHLSEQPLPQQRNPIWMVTLATTLAEQGEQRAATITRDGGETFQQTLEGELIYDFAFRGETVYAASPSGIFVSESRTDTSYTWRLIRDFPGADFPQPAIDKDRPVFAVATTAEALWAGTEDGLLKSIDGGETWEVFRARVPTDPDEPTEAVPETDTYAYPNPFSPVAAPSGVVRIVTKNGAGSGTANVQVYDFAMDPVRQLTGDCDMEGRCEVAWDGTGSGGARVANGVYFYEIEAGSKTSRGKIMVLE